MMPPGIAVRDLSLSFGGRTIFEHLNFDIKGGSFAALLGASGCGKTSLLKIIAGLATADAGQVLRQRWPAAGGAYCVYGAEGSAVSVAVGD